jgi:hypothetical protein
LRYCSPEIAFFDFACVGDATVFFDADPALAPALSSLLGVLPGVLGGEGAAGAFFGFARMGDALVFFDALSSLHCLARASAAIFFASLSLVEVGMMGMSGFVGLCLVVGRGMARSRATDCVVRSVERD